MTAFKAMAAKAKAPPDPARYMPVEAVQAMMADRHAELVSVADGRAQEKVNAAFRQGYIHGGMRDWALSLCRSDEAAFDTFLAKTGPVFGNLTKTLGAAMGKPPPAPAGIRSDTADSICRQLGLKPGSLTA